MPVRRHYSKAPITEAIIDLRVELPEATTIADLAKVHTGLEAAYPKVQQRNLAVVQGHFGELGTAAAASSEQLGYLFVSHDTKYIFQSRIDGFTMSRLAPYESWQPFRDEARRLWDAYRSIVRPNRVTRVALRYINRLDFPLPVRDLKDYLRTVPEVSTELPQGLAGYFMQLRIPLDDIRSLLLANQAIIAPASPDVVSVVIDNDVFRTDEIPADEGALWGFLDVLRERKNDVFEACITDKTRELLN